MRVKIFLGNFKYEGVLIAEDDTTYTIDDKMLGIIKIGKSGSVMQEMN